MLGTLTTTVDELRQWKDAWEALLEAMRAEMIELKAKLAEVEVTRVNGVITVQPGPRVDASKPKEFKGSHVAKDVDNFLWYMEQYFRAMGITNGALWVSTAAMYLTDNALLWWHRRSEIGVMNLSQPGKYSSRNTDDNTIPPMRRRKLETNFIA